MFNNQKFNFMKKLVSLVGVLSLSLVFLSAQTITSADFGSVGDSIFLGYDGTPNVSVGTSGTGKVWDFDTLDTETLDTLFFLNPSSLPNGSNFPSSNLAISSNQGVYFFEKTTSAVLNHGFSLILGPFASDVNYNPPLTYLQFPASLGTNFNTNSGFVAKSFLGIDTTIYTCVIKIDSAMVKRKMALSVNFDASGTIHLPTVTYNNALRAYSEETTHDSIFIYAPNPINCPPFLNIPAGWSLAPDFLLQAVNPNLSAVMLDTNRIYTWYAPNAKFSVCAIEVDYAGNVQNARFISDASQIGLSIDESQQVQMLLYPNPASTSFMIQAEQSLNQHTLQLMDLNGRIVKTQLLGNNQVVDVQTLDNGIYLIQVLNESGKVVYRNKVIVQK